MSSSNEKEFGEICGIEPKISLSMESFRVIKERKDAWLGDLVELEHVSTHQILLSKQIVIATAPQKHQEVIRGIQRRIKTTHPNIIGIKGFKYQFKEKLTISFFFESFLASAAAEFAHRAHTGTYFEESELLFSLDTCISALNHFQIHGIVHGNVTPHAIYMARSGDIKLADNGLLDQEDSLYHSIRSGQQFCYISPELLGSIRSNNKEPNLLPSMLYRSDVFSLGMTFLYAALLEEPWDCYDCSQYRFNSDALAARYRAVKKRYPGQFANLMRQLIKLDPNDRPDFVDLVLNLDSYKQKSESDDLEFVSFHKNEFSESFETTTRGKAAYERSKGNYSNVHQENTNSQQITEKKPEVSSIEPAYKVSKDRKHQSAQDSILLQDDSQGSNYIATIKKTAQQQKEFIPTVVAKQEDNAHKDSTTVEELRKAIDMRKNRAAKLARAEEIKREIEMRNVSRSTAQHPMNIIDSPNQSQITQAQSTPENLRASISYASKDIEPSSRVYFDARVVDIIKETRKTHQTMPSADPKPQRKTDSSINNVLPPPNDSFKKETFHHQETQTTAEFLTIPEKTPEFQNTNARTNVDLPKKPLRSRFDINKVNAIVNKIQKGRDIPEQRDSYETFVSAPLDITHEEIKMNPKPVPPILLDANETQNLYTPQQMFTPSSKALRSSITPSDDRLTLQDLSNTPQKFQSMLQEDSGIGMRNTYVHVPEDQLSSSQRAKKNRYNFLDDNPKLLNDISLLLSSRKSPRSHQKPTVFPGETIKPRAPVIGFSPRGYRESSGPGQSMWTQKLDSILAKVRNNPLPVPRRSPLREESSLLGPIPEERNSTQDLSSSERKRVTSPVKDYERVEIRQTEIYSPIESQKLSSDTKRARDSQYSSGRKEFSTSIEPSKPIQLSQSDKFSFHVNTAELGLPARSINKITYNGSAGGARKYF